MPDQPKPTIQASPIRKRFLGRLRGSQGGPTVLTVGGIHGNEPAGVRAATRVLERLERHGLPRRGEVVALAGNLKALERRTRFIAKDLNRRWLPETVAAVRDAGTQTAAFPEDREQVELLSAIESILRDARGEAYFLDLHTSSAAGSPFVTVGDTLRNRAFARRVPLPLILGLEEQVDGALLEYLNNLGLITLGVEGGQHDAAESVDHIESVLWVALAASGVVDARDVPDLAGHHRRLREAGGDTPRVVEVRYRHPVAEGDGFCMEPGLSNFQPVAEGQLLARSHEGAIRAREGGLVLLPLYQGQGDDGFFIAREVKPAWLTVSAVLRRLRVGRLVPVMPGVRAHPEREGTLVVDTRVARLFALDVLHLLGYRKLRAEGRHLVVTRRRFDP